MFTMAQRRLAAALWPLAATGSISNSSAISIAAGATFDVSAFTVFALTTSNALSASGTASPATINGAASGTVDLGSQPINLTFDGTDPSLVVTQAMLNLDGNVFTVNNTGSPLAPGTYTLINVTSGTITTNGAFSATVTGNGLASGTVAFITVNGGNVNLVVPPAPVFSSLAASQSISYGTSGITFAGTLSAVGPIYPAMGETVTVTINGNAQNTTISDGVGTFSFIYNPSTSPASVTPYTIT